MIINLVAGPGSGKTTIAANLFSIMKIEGFNIEYVQEVAKRYVWLGDFETLNNQYYISREQYKLFKSMNNVIDYIVTDGSLLHGLWYNRYNQDNLSNVEKTENAILDWYYEFDNIVFFLDRNDIRYEEAGRIQTEDEAKQIDRELKDILDEFSIEHIDIRSNISSIPQIIDYVKNYV